MTGKARTLATVAGMVLVLVVLALSHRFGRAEPTGDYRPDVPPEALTTGCYPLPGDVRFSFAYQTRRDGDVEIDGQPRRRYVGQYDEIDATEAVEAIVADFETAGYVRSPRPGPYDAVLRPADRGAAADDTVRLTVEQLPGIEADTLVRGVFVLELPVVEVQSDAAVCSDPKATKRWDEAA